MLQRLRELLTLILISLLPFHALFVTVGTKLFLGPDYAPWPVLAMWKEAVLGVILVIALMEILQRRKFRIDAIDGLIFALFLIAVLLPKTNFLFGFKYDFIPLAAFLILRRTPWSEMFWPRAERALLWVGGIVAAYGIATFFFPDAFFRQLGYSSAHSLYIPGGPLAAFQKIGGPEGLRRIQSTFSGPNQLAMWLLISWSICAVRIASEKLEVKSEKIFHYSLFTLLFVALVLTFSRSAWIAAFAIAVVTILSRFPRRLFWPMLASVGAVAVIVVIAASLLWPNVLIRLRSSRDHLVRPLLAIQIITDSPLGRGLGSAGPASNRVSDPCVFLDAGSDASWAADRNDLCVFVGDVQVQPTDRSCTCPFLSENWYLQIGVELGWLGLVLYVTLIVLLLMRLRATSGGLRDLAIPARPAGGRHPPSAIFLIFLGISIAALFLHAWEDSAVAYTAWILVASISTLSPWNIKEQSSSSTSAVNTRT